MRYGCSAVWNFGGEGFALFDILRLKKPIIRKDTNYEAKVQFNLEPESQIMIYRIDTVRNGNKQRHQRKR